jgi:hypothetical protein
LQVTSTWPLQLPAAQVPALRHLLPPPPQVPPLLMGVTVQAAVPLQLRDAHVSEVQVIGEPTQVPLPLHASAKVQLLASSQLVPAARGVTVQVAVPLQLRVLHASEAQLTAVPVHRPSALHASPKVQALPSLQVVPMAATGLEQLPVAGLHVPATWHASSAAQVTGLPPVQEPDWHVSVCVQALPSLQAVPLGALGFEQVPVAGLQVPATWH